MLPVFPQLFVQRLALLIGCLNLFFIGLLLVPDVRFQLFTSRLGLGNLLLFFLKLCLKGLLFVSQFLKGLFVLLQLGLQVVLLLPQVGFLLIGRFQVLLVALLLLC